MSNPLDLLVSGMNDDRIWEDIWKELRWDILRIQRIFSFFSYYCSYSPSTNDGIHKYNWNKQQQYINQDVPLHIDNIFCNQYQNNCFFPISGSLSSQTSLTNDESGKRQSGSAYFMNSHQLEIFFKHYGLPTGDSLYITNIPNSHMFQDHQSNMCNSHSKLFAFLPCDLTPLAISFLGCPIINSRHFLQFCAICSIDSPHNIFRPLGLFRLAIIHRRYDKGLKGYLNNDDFDHLQQDIVAVSHTFNPFHKNGLHDTYSKKSLLPLNNILEELSSRGIMSPHSYLNFSLFVQAVNYKLIQGTSKLLRLTLFYRSYHHDIHNRHPYTVNSNTSLTYKETWNQQFLTPLKNTQPLSKQIHQHINDLNYPSTNLSLKHTPENIIVSSLHHHPLTNITESSNTLKKKHLIEKSETSVSIPFSSIIPINSHLNTFIHSQSSSPLFYKETDDYNYPDDNGRIQHLNDTLSPPNKSFDISNDLSEKTLTRQKTPLSQFNSFISPYETFNSLGLKYQPLFHSSDCVVCSNTITHPHYVVSQYHTRPVNYPSTITSKFHRTKSFNGIYPKQVNGSVHLLTPIQTSLSNNLPTHYRQYKMTHSESFSNSKHTKHINDITSSSNNYSQHVLNQPIQQLRAISKTTGNQIHASQSMRDLPLIDLNVPPLVPKRISNEPPVQDHLLCVSTRLNEKTILQDSIKQQPVLNIMNDSHNNHMQHSFECIEFQNVLPLTHLSSNPYGFHYRKKESVSRYPDGQHAYSLKLEDVNDIINRRPWANRSYFPLLLPSVILPNLIELSACQPESIHSSRPQTTYIESLTHRVIQPDKIHQWHPKSLKWNTEYVTECLYWKCIHKATFYWDIYQSSQLLSFRPTQSQEETTQSIFKHMLDHIILHNHTYLTEPYDILCHLYLLLTHNLHFFNTKTFCEHFGYTDITKYSYDAPLCNALCIADLQYHVSNGFVSCDPIIVFLYYLDIASIYFCGVICENELASCLRYQAGHVTDVKNSINQILWYFVLMLFVKQHIIVIDHVQHTIHSNNNLWLYSLKLEIEKLGAHLHQRHLYRKQTTNETNKKNIMVNDLCVLLNVSYEQIIFQRKISHWLYCQDNSSKKLISYPFSPMHKKNSIKTTTTRVTCSDITYKESVSFIGPESVAGSEDQSLLLYPSDDNKHHPFLIKSVTL